MSKHLKYSTFNYFVNSIWISKVLFILVFVTGCATVPLTKRKQMNLLPEKELISMSLTEYRQFLTQHPPMSAPNNNATMVNMVGHRISFAVSEYLRHHKMTDRIRDFQWEFNLVNAPEANAWCMPGGKVVVYSGLLPVTADEAGLAFVMGHEIAHAVARHGNERMSQMLLAETGGLALDLALANKPAQTRAIFQTAYGIGSTVGVLLPYSRLHESEADQLGMIFMAMAGYDPSAAPIVWERMIALNKGPKPPEILSTHPADNKRVEAIRGFVPSALKYYKPR